MSDEHPISSSSLTNSSMTTTSPNASVTANTSNASASDNTINDSDSSSSVLIGLQIKSLEQRTHSVTLPRNSSVLQLKNEIQATLDVESGRQRLIFQGKVLKDDKNLMDYANLDDGKVIHLVIRPLDAPRNPMNDEPRPTGRRIFGNRGRPFPSIASRLPMMEGYTFITLDAHIGDNGDNNSFFSSIMNGLTGANPFNGSTQTQNGRSIRISSMDQASVGQQQQQQQSTLTSNLFPSFLTRSPFELRRSLENSTNTNNTSSNTLNTTSNTATTTTNDNSNTTSSNDNGETSNTSSNTARSSARLPLPSSVEMRLSRSVAYIRNVSNILEAPVEQQMSQIPYTSASSPEFIQEIRSTLRGNGNSQSYQVGMVMNELSDLMERGTPWLRETARSLQNEGALTTNEENVRLFRRVLRAARVIQGMSLINHFMGSVLTSVDMDGQRSNSQETARTSIFDPPISGDSWVSSGNTGSRSTSDQTSSAASRTTDNSPPSPVLPTSAQVTATKETSASTSTASSSNTITSSAGSKETEDASTAMEVDRNENKRKRDEDNRDETISNKHHQSEKGKSKNKTD